MRLAPGRPRSGGPLAGTGRISRVVCLAPVLFLPLPARPGPPTPPLDRIVLTDGRVLRAVVRFQAEDHVVVDVGGRERDLPRAAIVSMEGPRLAYPGYIVDLLSLESPAAETYVGLAERCTRLGLIREREAHLWRALLLDPSSEAAHRALGHHKTKAGWRVPVEGEGLLSVEATLRARHTFHRAWRLTTTHFDLRAAGDLQAILDAARDLEVLYDAFFTHLGPILEAREILDPLRVEIHPSRKEWPSGGSHIAAYYDASNDVVRTYFQNDQPVALVHEAVHAIVAHVGSRTRKSRADVPGWLNEGLAQYLTGCMVGPAGHRRFASGRRVAGWFARHATEPKPYPLSRVLTFRSADFAASSRQGLKYAQSYTLVHFLLNTEEPEIREGMRRFLARAFSQVGSKSSFLHAIGMPASRLESLWRRYVGWPSTARDPPGDAHPTEPSADLVRSHPPGTRSFPGLNAGLLTYP